MNDFFIQSFSKRDSVSPLSSLASRKYKNLIVNCFNMKSIALTLVAVGLISTSNIELKESLIKEKSVAHKEMIKERRNSLYVVKVDLENERIEEGYNSAKDPQFNYTLNSLKEHNHYNEKYFTSNYDGTPTDKDLEDIAKPYGINPQILKFVMLKESSGDCSKVSNKGAKGCFQFLDSTAKEFGLDDIQNGYQSADTAARYMLWLNKLINGEEKDINDLNNLQYVLAAYNAGLANVVHYEGLRIPNFSETQSYVEDILGALNGTKHYVQKGELIHDIAEQYEISSQTLIRSNLFKINENDDLKWGQFIDIENKDNVEIKIKITEGINLYRTSLRSGVSLNTLMSYNNINNPNHIKLGSYLIIPPREQLTAKIKTQASLKND